MDEAVDLSAALQGVLARRQYILGREVERFERAFSEYIGMKYCVGVANGTDALELAMRAVGVVQGDPVALVANAGSYGSAALGAVGGTAVFVDVDPQTRTMSLDGLQFAIQRGVRAAVVTHLYGQMADIEALVALASRAGVAIIEDCAQAHGARHGVRHAGSFGIAGCFSFYPTKNLGAIGDAGAVVTNDEACHTRLLQLRTYGWRDKYHVVRTGGRNSRLDELQAAVLSARLPHLDGWNRERQAIARRYTDLLRDAALGLPRCQDDFVAHLYVAEVANREQFRAALSDQGVSTDIHYPVPDHRQPIAQGYDSLRLPVTEALCDQVVTLPCYPGLTEAEQDVVVSAVRRALAAT